ncbi:MAG: RraA family protein [Chloroflexota bacterium]
MKVNDIKKRLLDLDTASLADANKGIRIIDPGIRPLRLGLKLIGVAHTVQCHEDFLTVIKALKDAVPGEVLVIDTKGSLAAVAGELFATEAQRKGLAGLIIDGPCRDSAKIRTLNMPVYSRGQIPVAGTTSGIFETQIPITCGGVTVNSGDILLGDDDGIIVSSATELAELIPIAETIQTKEAAILKQMEQGESLLGMLNFDEHWETVQSGGESQLGFKI